MARRKFEPGGNGESRIVEIPSSTNGVCENKLFYAHRLKELRTIAHLTQADLANALGLCKSAVANWESGRTRPDVSNIPTICRTLGISIEEYFSDSQRCVYADADERKLVFNYRQMSRPHQKAVLNMSEQLLMAEEDMNAMDAPELDELLFADDQVAAGTSYDDFSACCKPCYVHTSPMVRRADYIFRVNGDSMEPDYPNGCCVLVKKDDGLMRYGDVGVFQADNSLYMKEYRKEGLHSLNPAYATMRREDYGMIRAIGRVIGVMDADGFASDNEVAAFKTHCKRK